MDLRKKTQRYAEVATEAEEDERRPTFVAHARKHYKPPATRAPTLMIFTLILVLCLVLVEILFRRTSPEKPTDEASLRFVRRQHHEYRPLHVYTSQIRDVNLQSHQGTQVTSLMQHELAASIYKRDSSAQPASTAVPSSVLPTQVPSTSAAASVAQVSSALSPSAAPPSSSASQPPSQPSSVQITKTVTDPNQNFDPKATTPQPTTPQPTTPQPTTPQPTPVTTNANFDPKATTAPPVVKIVSTTVASTLTNPNQNFDPKATTTPPTTPAVSSTIYSTGTNPNQNFDPKASSSVIVRPATPTSSPIQTPEKTNTDTNGNFDPKATPTASAPPLPTVSINPPSVTSLSQGKSAASTNQQTNSGQSSIFSDVDSSLRIDLGATSVKTTQTVKVTTAQIDLGASSTLPTTQRPTPTSTGQIDLKATTSTIKTATHTDQFDPNAGTTSGSRTKTAEITYTSGALLDPSATTSKGPSDSSLPTITITSATSSTAIAASGQTTSSGGVGIPSDKSAQDSRVSSIIGAAFGTTLGQSSASMVAIETTETKMVTTTDAQGHISSYMAVAVYTTLVPTTPNPTITPSSTSSSVSLYEIEVSTTTMVTTTDAYGHVSSFMAVAVYKTHVSTSPTPTPTPIPETSKPLNPTAPSGLPPIATLTQSEEVVEGKFTDFSYFAALYLPALLAVVLKIYWEIVFSAFKMMEPFEQLYKIGGGLASRTMFAQYLSNSLSFDALRSLFRGSLLPTLSSTVYLLVILLAPLSASTMTVKARAYCEVAPDKYHRCMGAWVVDMRFLRFLEVCLGVCILFSILVLVLSWKRKNGLSSAPSSIASLAALFNHNVLAEQFRELDPSSDSWTIESTFESHCCRLAYHGNGNRKDLYGIESRPLMLPDLTASQPSQTQEGKKGTWFGGYSAVPNPSSMVPPKKPWYHLSNRTAGHLLDSIQLFTSLGLFAVVLAYGLDGKSDPFNNFFNSWTIWPRLVLVSSASLVAMQWNRLEREVRITEPYRRLSYRFATPENTILITLHGTPWSELPKCAYRLLLYPYMGYSSLVTVVAALSDINIIVTAGIPFSDGQTTLGLKICLYMSLTILALMVVTMLVTMLWWRRGVLLQMPRCPETIGDVLSYLCASQMTKDFSDGRFDGLNQKERDRRVIRSGRRFWFGRMVGIDGVERWQVDYESSQGKAEIVEDIEGVDEAIYKRTYDSDGTGHLLSIPTAYHHD